MLVSACVIKTSEFTSPYTGYRIKDFRKEFEIESKRKAIQGICYQVYMEHQEVISTHVSPLISYGLIMSSTIISNVEKIEPDESESEDRKEIQFNDKIQVL